MKNKPYHYCRSVYPTGWAPSAGTKKQQARRFNKWQLYIAKLNLINVERYFA
jgi:hypothetical protein